MKNLGGSNLQQASLSSREQERAKIIRSKVDHLKSFLEYGGDFYVTAMQPFKDALEKGTGYEGFSLIELREIIMQCEIETTLRFKSPEYIKPEDQATFIRARSRVALNPNSN